MNSAYNINVQNQLQMNIKWINKNMIIAENNLNNVKSVDKIITFKINLMIIRIPNFLVFLLVIKDNMLHKILKIIINVENNVWFKLMIHSQNLMIIIKYIFFFFFFN